MQFLDRDGVRKEAKVKELVRTRHCYITSYGQVLKKRPGSTWWEWLEDEGYFYKICLCQLCVSAVSGPLEK